MSAKSVSRHYNDISENIHGSDQLTAINGVAGAPVAPAEPRPHTPLRLAAPPPSPLPRYFFRSTSTRFDTPTSRSTGTLVIHHAHHGW